MMRNVPQPFGQLPGGETVFKVDIAGQGLRASVLTYGATVQALHLAGHAHSMVLGVPRLQDYLMQPIYLGATVGRVANRIADGRFSLLGKSYQLDRNEQDRHMLHGGRVGAAQMNWQIIDVGETSVELALVLPDGQMGFPGTMQVSAIFRVLPGPTLELEIIATTQAPTNCNFAHHGYFNLSGEPTVRDHQLCIPAEVFQTTDASLIPHPVPRGVAGTPFDLRQPRRLGDILDSTGLDNNYCFDHSREEVAFLARLQSPASGVALEIHSTEPGLQVYDGAGTDLITQGAEAWPSHAGIALEPQNWPNAINNPNAPSAVLMPDETYRQVTRFSFRG